MSESAAAAPRFIQACLRSRIEPAARAALRPPAAASDWAQIEATAQADGLAPLLYNVLRGQGIAPPDVERRLGAAYYASAARNTLLLRAVAEVNACLVGAGLAPIWLKGASLTLSVYAGNPALRPMGDLDLLVRRAEAATALAALAEAGYRPFYPELRPGANLAYGYEAALRRPGAAASFLDLHWSLLNQPYYARRVPAGWLWASAGPAAPGASTGLTLGPAAQVLHLCAHYVLHHNSRSLLRAHDVAEVIVWAGDRLDWDELLRRAATCDLLLPLQTTLPRLAAEWGAPVPATVLARLAQMAPSPAERRVHALRAAAMRAPARRLWYELAGLPGPRARLGYLWANLFPSPTYMREHHGVAHPILLPLAYPRRWLAGLRHDGRAHGSAGRPIPAPPLPNP